MRKILITGATGFIGSHLVEKNLQAGNQVRILALPEDPAKDAFKSKGCEVFSGDIADYKSIENAVNGVDTVFHLAGIVTDWAPEELFTKVNVIGTANICKASLKCGIYRLVEVSTNDVFGLRENITIDESLEYQKWGEPYPDTKIESSRIVWKYFKKGLAVTKVYPCWVYGPGDRTFVPLIADAIRKGNLIFWRKNTTIWPTYIDNLIDLLMVISEHPAAVGEGFLVHDGESDTLQNFSAKIAEEISAKKPTIHIPYRIALITAYLMESIWRITHRKTRPLLTSYVVKNLGSRLSFSIEKAQKLLGWQPEISYEQGFRLTMDWLKSTNPELWKQK